MKNLIASRNQWTSLVVVVTALSGVAPLQAGITDTFFTLSDFEAVVGTHELISFSEVPIGTTLIDQFSSQGVGFVHQDEVTVMSSVFPDDQTGVDGQGTIELTFASEQTFVGVDFPGGIVVSLFSGDTLVGRSTAAGGVGAGRFLGVMSAIPFDRVFLEDPADGLVFIDNLRFESIPVSVPESETIVLLAMGGLGLFMIRHRSRSRIEW